MCLNECHRRYTDEKCADYRKKHPEPIHEKVIVKNTGSLTTKALVFLIVIAVILVIVIPGAVYICYRKRACGFNQKPITKRRGTAGQTTLV